MNEILYRASAFTIYYLVGIRPFNCSAKTVNALHKSNVKCILYFDSSNLTFNLGFARFLCPPHLLCIAFGSGFVLFTLFFVFLFSRSSTFCLAFAICYLFVFVSLLFFFLSILLQINLIILFDQSIQRQTNSTNKLFVCLWIYFVVIFAMAMAIAMTLDCIESVLVCFA